MKKLIFTTIFLIIGFSAFLAVRAGINTATPGQTGLVGYWSFDEGSGSIAGDFSGNGNDGTLQEAPQWTDGKMGEALKLDGSGTVDGTVPGDHVEVPESITRTDNYPEGATYSIWLKVDTDAVNRMSLFRGAGTSRHIEIYSDSKKFRTEAAKQNGYSFGTGNFPDDVKGEWSHFVIVFANNEPGRPVRWYQNGSLFHTGDLSSGDYPDTEYFSFGSIGRSTGNTSYTYAKSFDGIIDEVRVYGRALSESEIQDLYEKGLMSVNPPDNTGLVGHWRLDRENNSNYGETSDNPAKSCLDIKTTRPGATDGVYWINPRDPFQVDCVMSGDGGGWIKVSLDRTNSNWAVGNDHDRCSGAGDSAQYYNHLTTSDYNFAHDTDDHTIYKYDVDYTSAGSSLTESQEGYIRGLVEQVSPNTRPVGVSCDDDSSGIEHNTYLYDDAGNQFELQEGYVGASNHIGWWGWSQDSADSFVASTSPISGKDNSSIPSGFLMPASVGLQTDYNGYAVFAYEESYALFRESGGLKDYSDSGNGGVLFGGPQWTDGRIENALEFDGSDDYVEILDSNTLDLTQGFLLTGWVYHQGSSNDQNIITKENSYEIAIDSDGTLKWALYTSGGWEWHDSGQSVPQNEWHYISFSYNGSDGIFYIDGSQVSSISDPDGGSIDTNSNNVWIGARANGGGMSWFDGKIDDVRIYDRALSESEIKRLYKMGR
jgi:hypothetical protein